MNETTRRKLLCSLDVWQPHERTRKCEATDRMEDSDALDWLALNDYTEAGFHAGANPLLSQAGRQEVAKASHMRGRGGRLGLLANPATTQEDFDLLGESNDNETRIATARLASSELSLEVLLGLAFDKNTAVILAPIPDLPQRVYGVVMGHRQALPALVKNPSCPETLLKSVLEGRDPGLVHILLYAVQNPTAPIGSILSLPSDCGLAPDVIEEVVQARKAEAEAWLLSEYGAEVDLDNTPLEWVRELFQG